MRPRSRSPLPLSLLLAECGTLTWLNLLAGSVYVIESYTVFISGESSSSGQYSRREGRRVLLRAVDDVERRFSEPIFSRTSASISLAVGTRWTSTDAARRRSAERPLAARVRDERRLPRERRCLSSPPLYPYLLPLLCVPPRSDVAHDPLYFPSLTSLSLSPCPSRIPFLERAPPSPAFALPPLRLVRTPYARSSYVYPCASPFSDPLPLENMQLRARAVCSLPSARRSLLRPASCSPRRPASSACE